MIIKEKGLQITIADDSPTVLKIKEGYNYDVVNSKIEIGEMYTIAKNKWQIKKEVEKVNDIPRLKELIIKILDLI